MYVCVYICVCVCVCVCVYVSVQVCICVCVSGLRWGWELWSFQSHDSAPLQSAPILLCAFWPCYCRTQPFTSHPKGTVCVCGVCVWHRRSKSTGATGDSYGMDSPAPNALISLRCKKIKLALEGQSKINLPYVAMFKKVWGKKSPLDAEPLQNVYIIYSLIIIKTSNYNCLEFEMLGFE